ncbi:MAG TPA: alpha/beta hydrolase [Saprospiraceae bacterium]|nr:alpha/beta hydrolase [Saprospiraceae bacterium]HPI05611.1 alpha/beta hydrolase [Saprospiraceae bacterium]
MMKPIYTSFLLLCCCGFSSAQGYCADGIVYLTENHAVTYDDVMYKQAAAIDEWFFDVPENIPLRVYYPSDLPAGEQRPLVILIHGGYFIAGSYHDFNAFAEAYAKLGFVCATIDYRLCKRNDCLLANVFSPCNISWGYSFMPSAYVAAVDVNDGIRWLQQHAADYHIDPEKVVVSGHSAGAFTAMNVAFLDQQEIQEIMPGAGLPGHDYISEPLDPVEGIRAVVPMAGATFNPEWIGTQEIVDRNIAVGVVHGTADGVVDYDVSAAIPCCQTYQTQVYGGCAIAERVHQLGGNLFMLSGEGFGHDIGDSLFLQAIMQQVPAFIVKTVLCGESVSLHTSVQRDPPLAYCPDGTGTAEELCDVLPLTPGGFTVPVYEPSAKPAIQLACMPSPLSGTVLHVDLNIPAEGVFQCVVRDQSGRVAIQKTLYLSAGRQRFELEMPVPEGLYYLNLQGENLRSRPVKIVKL